MLSAGNCGFFVRRRKSQFGRAASVIIHPAAVPDLSAGAGGNEFRRTRLPKANLAIRRTNSLYAVSERRRERGGGATSRDVCRSIEVLRGRIIDRKRFIGGENRSLETKRKEELRCMRVHTPYVHPLVGDRLWTRTASASPPPFLKNSWRGMRRFSEGNSQLSNSLPSC